MSFIKGKQVEEELKELLKLRNYKIVDASPEQDMTEHWDFLMYENDSRKSIKVDVKGLKRASRDDDYTQEDFHFIELQNVNGDTGWLFGKANMIAFETFRYWVFVEIGDLKSFIKKVLDKNNPVDNVHDCLYKPYRRKDRRDIITKVKTIDLMGIHSLIFEKVEIPCFK